MSEPVLIAVISAVGAIVVAIITIFVGFLIGRGRNTAEIAKLRAETDKLLKETEQLQNDQRRLEAETEEIRQVISYQNYEDAFREMGKRIEDYLSRHYDQEKHETLPDPEITLKLIAVAMTFSWDTFIQVTLRRIINTYPKAKFHLDVLFIDHKYLKEKPLADFGVQWIDRSKQRVEDVHKFAEECRKYFSNRVHFRAKVYRNLPHWHGWLVNDNNLYLGRADWEYQSAKPMLRVGQNKYRHFDTSNNEGTERIELFKSWQRYYFEFDSDKICDSADAPAATG